jgi:NAD(P)-dependent dehydrogenase (short-subunit alcohol dehydrogenase family)
MASSPPSLAGRVAVVTGGGRGIGRAVAEALAEQGMRVAVGDLDGEAAARAPVDYGAALDVTDRPAFTAFLDEVERRLGPLDVLVNNAGIMPIGPFDEESDATATRLLELNLHAVIHGCKEAVRRMKPRGHGHIVNVASVVGKTGAPGGATYAATKHGVVGLSESLVEELRGTGVNVSVVLPALVTTELAAGTRNIRGVRRTAPEEVADAVLLALRDGRFELYVPRALRPLIVLGTVLPRRWRDGLTRVLGNGALLHADRGARADYEARVAAEPPSPGGRAAA